MIEAAQKVNNVNSAGRVPKSDRGFCRQLRPSSPAGSTSFCQPIPSGYGAQPGRLRALGLPSRVKVRRAEADGSQIERPLLP